MCVCYLWNVHHPPLFLVSVVPVQHQILKRLQVQALWRTVEGPSVTKQRKCTEEKTLILKILKHKPFCTSCASLPGVPTPMWTTPLPSSFIWSSTLMCLANSLATFTSPLNVVNCLKTAGTPISTHTHTHTLTLYRRGTRKMATNLMRSMVRRAELQTISSRTERGCVCCFCTLAHFGQTSQEKGNGA